ncbi:MAG: MBL fold metallo-hydrolase [candidate division SR1 bacterium]|nr:MBL fold metallo-hydrolase [candidate division SR1 bacterium]
MYTYKNITIDWLGHDGFLIDYKDKKICIDPFQIKKDFKADYIFFTHNHKDHLSPDDISRVILSETILVAPSICETDLKAFSNKKIFLKQTDVLDLDIFSVTTLPAYNIDKFRSPGVPYHPQEVGFVGFVFNFDGTTVYHTGDSDIIPKMNGISPDVLFLPVSGKYVMTPEEAVHAIEIINPKVAIPMHYDSIIGTWEDAKYVQEHASCEVVILK